MLFSSWISQSLEKVTSCCPWERFENWNELENLLLLSVSEDGILEINSMRQEVIIFIHPEEEEIGVILDHGGSGKRNNPGR